MLVSLRIYFDGAGDVDKPVMTVGGFMADCTTCEAIERDWEEATKGHLFHLTDFGTNKCKLGSRGWTETERTSFLKRLANIVNRPNCYILSASIEVALFNEALLKTVHPQEIGPAFSGCAYAAIMNTETILLNERRELQKASYIFEKGDREHEVSITFADWDQTNSRLCGLRGHSLRYCSPPILLLE
jgi:hypothetical protein